MTVLRTFLPVGVFQIACAAIGPLVPGAPGKNLRILRWANAFSGTGFLFLWAAFPNQEIAGRPSELFLIGVMIAFCVSALFWLRASGRKSTG